MERCDEKRWGRIRAAFLFLFKLEDVLRIHCLLTSSIFVHQMYLIMKVQAVFQSVLPFHPKLAKILSSRYEIIVERIICNIR